MIQQVCLARWTRDVAQMLGTKRLRLGKFRIFQSWRHGHRLSPLLENLEMVSKAWLRRCKAMVVVSRVQRFHVALAEKVFLEQERLAQELLATEHWQFVLSAKKIIWIGETGGCVLGVSRERFNGSALRSMNTSLETCANHSQAAPTVHRVHQASDQVASALMLSYRT